MRKFSSGLAVVLAISAVLASPESARADNSSIKPKDSYPVEVVRMVEKGFSGPLSDNEANTLKNDYPELAAITPDYRINQTQEEKVSLPIAASLASTGCKTASGTHHAKTLFGSTFYRMNTSVDYCWDTKGVTSVTNIRTHFSDVVPQAEIGNVVEENMRPGLTGHAHHKYLVKNVIPVWGQVNAKYPFNTFTLEKGGIFHHSHGE